MLDKNSSQGKEIVQILEIKNHAFSLIDDSVNRLQDNVDHSPVIMAMLVKDTKKLMKLQKRLASK